MRRPPKEEGEYEKFRAKACSISLAYAVLKPPDLKRDYGKRTDANRRSSHCSDGPAQWLGGA
jgi:hypothetical protein